MMASNNVELGPSIKCWPLLHNSILPTLAPTLFVHGRKEGWIDVSSCLEPWTWPVCRPSHLVVVDGCLSPGYGRSVGLARKSAPAEQRCRRLGAPHFQLFQRPPRLENKNCVGTSHVHAVLITTAPFFQHFYCRPGIATADPRNSRTFACQS